MYFKSIPTADPTIPFNHTKTPWIPNPSPNYSASLQLYIDKITIVATETILSSRIRLNEIDTLLYKTLLHLRRQNHIVMKPADKNLGLCILNRVDYIDMCMTHLNDALTYQPVPKYTHKVVVDKLRKIILSAGRMFVENSIDLTPLSKSLLQYENPETCRISLFYCLPKVHKNQAKPPGRPIVSSCSSLTYPASKYVDHCLSPFLKFLNTICRSSNDFIRLLTFTKQAPTDIILCADVTSLYPNIPLDFGLEKVSSLLNHLNQIHKLIPPKDLVFCLDLMNWVLYNNYISFANTTYKQIKGTAMGTPVAVTFAQLFLAAIELPILSTTPCTLYQRYIDDICALISESAASDFIAQFNAVCPSIKLEAVTIGPNGIFLDLSLHVVNGSTSYTIYQKPANKYQYIPFLSAHNLSVFYNWVFEELKRYRVKCSTHSDFVSLTLLFAERLRARGYPPRIFALAMTNLPSRASLLKPILNPNKINIKHKALGPVLTLALPSLHPNPRWKLLLAIPPQIFYNRHYFEAYGNKQLVIGKRNPPNVASYVTHSKL